jgi:predicted phosphoribosyltransferase
MAFQNREDAARQLAERLSRYRGLDPVVLGVPRGGVPMARIVADALRGDLDVILVRTIRAPDNPANAVGAVDESGAITFVDTGRQDLTEEYIQSEARLGFQEICRRRRLYAPSRAPVALAGRIAIVVDDGITTGSSMLAAVRAIRKQRPKQLVVAVPIATPGSLVLVRREVDEIVCLLTPVPLVAIAGFYRDFPMVSDEQVVAALTRPTTVASAAPH